MVEPVDPDPYPAPPDGPPPDGPPPDGPPPDGASPYPGPHPAGGHGALSPLIDDRSSSRRWWIVGSCVAAAVFIALGAVVMLVGGDAPPNPIALPDTFAGYTRSYDPTAMGIETGMRTTMSARSKWTRLMKSAAIGTYQPAGSTADDIVVLVVPSSVGAATADDLTRSMLSLSDPNAGYEQIGKHGGSSRCATMTTNGRTVPVCAWRDSQTTGVLMSLGTALGTSDFTPHQLNSIELAFRDAVD